MPTLGHGSNQLSPTATDAPPRHDEFIYTPPTIKTEPKLDLQRTGLWFREIREIREISEISEIPDSASPTSLNSLISLNSP